MKVIFKDSKVKVHYTGKFTSGEIFDSSKAIEGTQITGSEPLEVQLGQGLLIPGFELGLEGMSEGDTKTLHIACDDAYGEPKESHYQEVDKTYVPETVTVGEVLQTKTEHGLMTVVVKEINEDTVLLDANHPLAGKDLIFDVEVLSIS